MPFVDNFLKILLASSGFFQTDIDKIQFLKLFFLIQLQSQKKKQKEKLRKVIQKLNAMSLIKPLQQNISESKQSILYWFSLSKEEKRSFNWQQKNILLYPMLMPLFYDEINLGQLLISHQELNDKFNKFFSSTFRLKTINSQNQEPFNLNEVFIFNLDDEIILREVFKKNAKNIDRTKKISAIYTNNTVKTWHKVQCWNNLVSLSSTKQGKDAKILCADKILMGRFQIEIMKQDYLIKSHFINQFLFCGTSPSYSINCLSVQKLKRGQTIKGLEQKIYVLFQGSVIHEINFKTSTKNTKILGQKWKFQLVRGSVICKASIKPLLMSSTQKSQILCGSQEQFVHGYQLVADSIFITITYSDLTRIIKSQKVTKRQLLEKIKSTQQTHDEFIRKSLNIEQKIREQEERPVEYHYSIPRNKKTKAFRKKNQVSSPFNCDEFITFDKYEIMTANKQNVERKHEVYAQLNNYLRQKEKQDRFMQKMNTEKGMKEFKRCEYQARLKQNKIQILAIKQSIFNAEKYRDRPHEVKFIFEEELMDRYLKFSKSSNKFNRTKKKFASMVEFSNIEIESKAYRTEQKPSFNEQLRNVPPSEEPCFFQEMKKNTLHFESTPNLLSAVPGRKKPRLGSAITLRRQTARLA